METTNRMTVFVNKRTGGYSGGMCMVAARSAEEAQKLLLKALPNICYMVDKNGDACWDEAECVEVESYYYKKDNWEQVSNVYCETDTPVFIDEDGYTE